MIRFGEGRPKNINFNAQILFANIKVLFIFSVWGKHIRWLGIRKADDNFTGG